MNAADIALCHTTARWLAACGRCAGALSGGIAIVSALALLGPHRPGAAAGASFAAALLLVLPERLLALRLAFDAGLFRDLAADPPGRADGPSALRLLDAALLSLGLRRAPVRVPVPVPVPVRPLAERVAGARRLSRQHLGLVLAQTAALAVALSLQMAGRAA